MTFMSAYEACRHAVEQASRDLHTDVRLAYIGNCGPGFDDRLWFIQFKDFRPLDSPSRMTDPHMLVLGKTSDLPTDHVRLGLKIRLRHTKLIEPKEKRMTD